MKQANNHFHYLNLAFIICISIFLVYLMHTHYEYLPIYGLMFPFKLFRLSICFIVCFTILLILLNSIISIEQFQELTNKLTRNNMNDNFWTSITLILLKLNCIIIPIAIIQFIFNVGVFEDNIKDFAYVIFFIQFILTIICYRIAYLNLVKSIKDSLNKLSDKF